MTNKLTTPLGINNIFTTEDCLVMEGDIKMIGKKVDALVVEFDQAAYKEYLSSRSRNPSPSHTLGGSSSEL